MFRYVKKKLNFINSRNKILERGQTKIENDSIHATIEHKSRNLSIYTAPQWATTISMVRSSNPYKVVELDSCDFLDFKCISESVPNFDFDIDEKRITWLKIIVITIKENDTYIIRFDYNDQISAYFNLACRVNLTRSGKAEAFSLPNVEKLYQVKSQPKLSTSMYISLVHLCRTSIIHEIYITIFGFQTCL